MNKEDILKAFPDYEEVDMITYVKTMKTEGFHLIVNSGENAYELFLKPKQTFSIVFEDNQFYILVFEDGKIHIENKKVACSIYRFYSLSSLYLLEQAIAKSKEIRGLK